MADHHTYLVFFFVVSLSWLSWSAYAYHFSISWVASPRESYNSWAGKMRFQVNDTISFKYSNPNDSVLVVSKEDYETCNASNPIETLGYRNGVSEFQFRRSGPFFFITGIKPSCHQGQKLIVVVMAVRHHRQPPPHPLPNHPPSTSPSGAPSTSPSGAPSTSPSGAPSTSPSGAPSTPSGSPSTSPSGSPSTSPSGAPSASPSGAPLTSPASSPSPGSSPAPGNSPSPGTGTSPPSPATPGSPNSSSPGGGGNTPPAGGTPGGGGNTPPADGTPSPPTPASLAVKGGSPSIVLVMMLSVVLSAVLGDAMVSL